MHAWNPPCNWNCLVQEPHYRRFATTKLEYCIHGPRSNTTIQRLLIIHYMYKLPVQSSCWMSDSRYTSTFDSEWFAASVCMLLSGWQMHCTDGRLACRWKTNTSDFTSLGSHALQCMAFYVYCYCRAKYMYQPVSDVIPGLYDTLNWEFPVQLSTFTVSSNYSTVNACIRPTYTEKRFGVTIIFHPKTVRAALKDCTNFLFIQLEVTPPIYQLVISIRENYTYFFFL